MPDTKNPPSKKAEKPPRKAPDLKKVEKPAPEKPDPPPKTPPPAAPSSAPPPEPKPAVAESAKAAAAEMLKESAAEIVQDVKAERKETRKKTTKRGRPTKAAKQAETSAEFTQLLTVALAGPNRLAAARAPELAYTAEEIETLATLGGVVLAKHVPDLGGKYAEEIALASVFAGVTIPKLAAAKAAGRFQRGKPKTATLRDVPERSAAPRAVQPTAPPSFGDAVGPLSLTDVPANG